MKIAIVDYHMGNLKSVVNAFVAVGENPILSNNPSILMSADAIVLPGVGSFPAGMKKLKELGLDQCLIDSAKIGTPMLGLCLGMQLFFESSNEFGPCDGLSIIDGKVVSLSSIGPSKIRLPNTGWREIFREDFMEWKGTILSGIKEKEMMYFVHSYTAIVGNKKDILALSSHGGFSFCAAVKKNNIYGCQFHPEKSSKEGLKIIKNFAKIARGEL